MKIYFAWHDRTGHNPNFRVWKPYPTWYFKYWHWQLWYFNFWKWSMIWDFRDRGFLGYILKTIWQHRLKERQN